MLIKRLLGAALAAPVAALVALPAASAMASTGPAVFSPEQAGYSGTGAHFRFAQASVTLPDATKFASSVGGFGFSLQLWSPSRVLVLGVSDSTSSASPYSPAFAVFDTATHNLICSSAGTPACPGTPSSWTSGAISFPATDSLTFSLFYDRTTGRDKVALSDTTSGLASLATFRTDFTGNTYNQVRAGAEFGCSPWDATLCGGAFTAPSAQTHLGTLRNVTITTYNGGRSGFVSWWANHQIKMTSTGTSKGVLEASPHNLYNSGRNFGVYLQPAPQG